ncbi:MAG: hypothetical protein AAFR90_07645 [Pseudomonadota bacterium]
MTDEKLSVEAKADGLSLEVAGKASQRLASQLSDLLSPFTEMAGIAGDHLRIWRSQSVAKALQHAHQKAKDDDIQLEPVPPKILSKWVEGASLEDNDELSEKWGNLLLNSMGEFDITRVWAISKLSELGPNEAKLLEDLYSVYQHNKRYNFNSFVYEHYRQTATKRFDHFISEAMQQVDSEAVIDRHSELRKIIEKLWSNRSISSFPADSIFREKGGMTITTSPLIYGHHYEMTLEVLASLNLIEPYNWKIGSGIMGDNYIPEKIELYSFNYYLLTKLGVRFMELVNQARLNSSD